MYFKMLKSNVFVEHHCYFYILHPTILYPVAVEMRSGKGLTSAKGEYCEERAKQW